MRKRLGFAVALLLATCAPGCADPGAPGRTTQSSKSLVGGSLDDVGPSGPAEALESTESAGTFDGATERDGPPTAPEPATGVLEVRISAPADLAGRSIDVDLFDADGRNDRLGFRVDVDGPGWVTGTFQDVVPGVWCVVAVPVREPDALPRHARYEGAATVAPDRLTTVSLAPAPCRSVRLNLDAPLGPGAWVRLIGLPGAALSISGDRTSLWVHGARSDEQVLVEVRTPSKAAQVRVPGGVCEAIARLVPLGAIDAELEAGRAVDVDNIFITPLLSPRPGAVAWLIVGPEPDRVETSSSLLPEPCRIFDGDYMTSEPADGRFEDQPAGDYLVGVRGLPVRHVVEVRPGERTRVRLP